MQNTEKSTDSLASWAWLATIAPLLAVAALHGRGGDNVPEAMRQMVARMAKLAGGHNEEDWATRALQQRTIKVLGPGGAEQIKAMGGPLRGNEDFELAKLLENPKTQWPPNIEGRRTALERSGYETYVEPNLPTSLKFDQVIGHPTAGRTPPTVVQGSSDIWRHMQSGGWLPGPTGTNWTDPVTGKPIHVEGRILPLDPYELFMTAMGPTNFEVPPPPRRMQPPPISGG